MELLVLNWSLLAVSIVVAFIYGGWIEKRGAIVLLAMVAIALSGRVFFRPTFDSVDYVSASQDVLATLAFACLGIFSRKVWPLWAAALQAISVGAHVVRHVETGFQPVVYAWMKSGPTWGVMLLLILGSLAHRQSVRLAGAERNAAKQAPTDG